MKQNTKEYNWFSDKLHNYKGEELWYFINFFGMYLFNAPIEQVEKGVIELKEIAINSYQFNNRLSAYHSLELLSDHQGVQEILNEINLEEQNQKMK